MAERRDKTDRTDRSDKADKTDWTDKTDGTGERVARASVAVVALKGLDSCGPWSRRTTARLPRITRGVEVSRSPPGAGSRMVAADLPVGLADRDASDGGTVNRVVGTPCTRRRNPLGVKAEGRASRVAGRGRGGGVDEECRRIGLAVQPDPTRVRPNHARVRAEGRVTRARRGCRSCRTVHE